MSVLSLDFETCSTVDLRKSGVYPYARHKDTKVICAAYSFDDGPVRVWRFDTPFPEEVLRHVQNGGEVRAWNAAFEIQVWNHTLLRQLGLTPGMYDMSINQVTDTMAQAAYYGLPLSLDQASEAAHTGHTKDKQGHALMMRMNKPRTRDKSGNGMHVWWHLTDVQKVAALCAYCVRDVEAERAIANTLPPLPAAEVAMWRLDQRINGRGVGLDLPLIEALEELAQKVKARIDAELSQITAGAVKSVGSAAAMLAFLNACGWAGDNLRKDTVEAALQSDTLTPEARRVLELRQAGSKTSAAKLPAMKLAAGVVDNFPCVRGMLQYYGAFRTGRWAGRLIQPQNMPRPVLKPAQIESAIVAVQNRVSPEFIELMFGVSAMEVVASLLRSVLVARPGKRLSVADFSQIEARVLPWLAGEQKVLDVFRSGKDVYKQSASDIYMKPPEAIDGDQRQIGKVATLALGFGGGKGAFQTMAQAYGVEVTDARAEQIKVAWRAGNPKIVEFWKALENAFRAACANNTSVIQVGKLRVGRWGSHVVIRLPSGRGLFYRDARLVQNPDDPSREDASYMGLNQYTRKWERLRTYGGKLAENVTQAVARDCMADVMFRADAHGIPTILTVHDELLTEDDDAKAENNLALLEKEMSIPPAWACDLPVGSDGWVGRRYRK